MGSHGDKSIFSNSALRCTDVLARDPVLKTPCVSLLIAKFKVYNLSSSSPY